MNQVEITDILGKAETGYVEQFNQFDQIIRQQKADI